MCICQHAVSAQAPAVQFAVCFPPLSQLLLAAIAGAAVGRGSRGYLPRIASLCGERKKGRKGETKLGRYRSGYRYNHNLTVTSRYACPVKVEYLPHDRLSAVLGRITGPYVIGKDLSYGFISEWRSIVELTYLKRPRDYPIEFGLT